MTISFGNPEASGPGWNRGRVVFLSVCALLVVLLFIAVRAVLLPFALALVIAYVLVPPVALCERIRIPRALSILIVYLVTGLVSYVSIATIAPRIFEESLQLARDAPTILRNLATRWGPPVDDTVQRFLERTGQSTPVGPPVAAQPGPALRILERAEGGYFVELGDGVDIVEAGEGRWHVQATEPQMPSRFSVAELVLETIGRFVKYVETNVLELIRVGQVVVSAVARGIFLLFMTLMVAGYLMHTRESIMAFFRSLPPAPSRPAFDRLVFRLDRGLAGVVRGQLLICLVNGVLSAIGFWMFDLKYWPILSIVAGLMSIIPIFGAILSSIPAVLIGLTQDFWTALWVLLWILGIHQIEANLLNPKIIGVAAKVHPVLVVFALIVGEHFFGLWGALFAVPVLSITQSVFNHFRFESLPDAAPDSLGPPQVVPIEPQRGG